MNWLGLSRRLVDVNCHGRLCEPGLDATAPVAEPGIAGSIQIAGKVCGIENAR